jgi:hypothetical protein
MGAEASTDECEIALDRSLEILDFLRNEVVLRTDSGPLGTALAGEVCDPGILRSGIEEQPILLAESQDRKLKPVESDGSTPGLQPQGRCKGQGENNDRGYH